MNISQKTCTYTNFFEYLRPYTHVITAYRFEAEHPYIYFNQVYQFESHRKTYYNSIILISIEDLLSYLIILPPKYIKLPRRLKTKRIRKGAQNRQARKYGNCKQPGYNTRRYVSYLIAKNRRRDQARDQNTVKDEDSDMIIIEVGNQIGKYKKSLGWYNSHKN